MGRTREYKGGLTDEWEGLGSIREDRVMSGKY